MSRIIPDIEIAKAVKQRFFLEFAEPHCRWLRELVSAYKERGIYPVFPTQIVDYYPDNADKEVAIFSAFCMGWDNDNVLEQMASVRQLMGEHPAQWFANREFASLSIGRMMNESIDGYAAGKYWRIAKVYDLLFDLCFDGRRVRHPSDVFKRESFDDFCRELSDVCNFNHIKYKRSVIELVLRASDGIGRALWPTTPHKVKCPRSAYIRDYLKEWFPLWTSKWWSWDEAVALFRLEQPYDFFYAYLAHQELIRTNPDGCRKYAQTYQTRWKNRTLLTWKYWGGCMGNAPKIEFKQ